MHVLGSIGHSFSQRRKSPKPKSLHIRKVSFSGCSLSSGCSFDSTSSSSTARAPSSVRSTGSSHSFDPLHSHPTFQPPPRLQDRPLLSPAQTSPSSKSFAFFDDSEAEEENSYYLGRASTIGGDDENVDYDVKEILDRQSKEMVLPPLSSPMDHSDDRTEAQDYFMMQLAKRPPMPRSRWSESTIQTLEDFTDGELSTPLAFDGACTPDSEADLPLEMPNFSHKRNMTPSRPPMRSLDSLEDFIKHGGWKRRGVVLNPNEAAAQEGSDA